MTFEEGFAAAGFALLRTAWAEALAREQTESQHFLASRVDAVFQASTGSYGKAAIVQSLGKATDVSLDALSVQKGADDESAWDARTFARATFVAWNEEANRPFSHAADPYVSNPLRIPRFDDSALQKARDKTGFVALVDLLEEINKTVDRNTAFDNLVEILVGLRRYLADKSVEYPLPMRASMINVLAATDQYLSDRSGGARLQAVVAALFKCLADSGFKFQDVVAGHINASDSSMRRGGDVEFQGMGGKFGVEVKDRSLSKDEFLASVEKARIAGVSDLMFVIRSDRPLEDDLSEEYFENAISRQFSSGLNIYLEDFSDFSRLTLSLIGEIGRHLFLKEVGEALEAQSVQIGHKWAWASIVKAL